MDTTATPIFTAASPVRSRRAPIRRGDGNGSQNVNVRVPFHSREGYQRLLRSADHHPQDQLLPCALLRVHRHRPGPKRTPRGRPLQRIHQQQHLSYRCNL